jgi:two-component sensor histidine kinase
MVEAVARPAPGPHWGHGLAKQYFRVLWLWNPLVTGVATLALGRGAGFWRGFPVSLLIATVSATVCFVPVALALALQHRARERGRPGPEHGRAWYMALALAAMPCGLLLSSYVSELVFGERAPASFQDYRLALFLGGVISGVFFLWQTQVDAKDAARSAELRREQAETQKLKAQLSALTAQLNPHLLFNALNTIVALVQTDPEQAEQTVLRLSDLYRGVLGATRRESHSLSQELDICQAYLDVERARFGERLSTRVEVGAGLSPDGVQVPALVLQPLVENAVTHGLSERAAGGSVVIRVESSPGQLTLSVMDDGVGLGQSTRQGSGLGIETTRQRLKLCYGEGASLELSPLPTGGTLALLRLPLQTTPTRGKLPL